MISAPTVHTDRSVDGATPAIKGRSPRLVSGWLGGWAGLAGALLLWMGSSGTGQAGSPPNPEQLRSPLIQAFQDWKWVSDRVVTVPPNYHGSSRYWLVTLEPRREGELMLRYEFQQANSRYQGGDRSYFVWVGHRGCQRELTIASARFGNSRDPDLCLGDRLVVPIELETHYFNYRFSDRDPAMTQADLRLRPPLPQSFDPKPVPNPIASWLAYRGRHIDTVSTAGGDRRVTWQAHWQAIAPGRWTLALAMQPSPELLALTQGAADSADSVDEYRTQVSGPDDQVTQAIVVLPANTPLTVLPLTMRGDNYYGSGAAANRSSVSDRFPVGQLVLRVGDRFQIPYGHATIARSSLPSTMTWNEQQAMIERLATTANTVLIQQKPFVPPALESPISGRDRATQRHFFDDWLEP